MSVFLIRLLQTFSGVSFAPDADPNALPPAPWATGAARRPIERVWLKTHLILHANVSLVLHGFPLFISHATHQNGAWFRMKEAEDDAVDAQQYSY